MFTHFLASLHYFLKSVYLVVLTTLIIAGIVTLLWNWQIVTITFLALPILEYWQAVAIVGIIQFIRIQI